MRECYEFDGMVFCEDCLPEGIGKEDCEIVFVGIAERDFIPICYCCGFDHEGEYYMV